MNDIKNEIVKYGKILGEKYLTTATSGNISVKFQNTVFITASGACLYDLSFQDIVEIDFEGNYNDCVKPSSEYLLHLETYKKRPDINVIFHTHPVYLCTFAASDMELNTPLLAEYVLQFDSIPVANYALPSSFEVAKITSDLLIKNNLVIMKNHGVVCVAQNCKKALYLLETGEHFARVTFNCHILNKQQPLSISQVQEIKTKLFK